MENGVKLRNGYVVYPRYSCHSNGEIFYYWLVVRPDNTYQFYYDPIVLILCEFFGGEKIV